MLIYNSLFCHEVFLHFNIHQLISAKIHYLILSTFSLQANEEIIDPTCQMKAICKAGGKLIYKELEPCQQNAICSVRNEKHACICKKGFSSYKGICQPEGI